VACIEEVAFEMGFISRAQLEAIADSIGHEYGAYLRDVAVQARLKEK
jgi:hypothetical protein